MRESEFGLPFFVEFLMSEAINNTKKLYPIKDTAVVIDGLYVVF